MHDASGFSNVFCASSYIISNFMYFFPSMVVCSFRSISRYTDTLPYFLLCFFICVLYGFFTPTIIKYVSTFLFIFHHILVVLLYILLSIVYHSFLFILILMTCAFFTSFKSICKTLSYLSFTFMLMLFCSLSYYLSINLCTFVKSSLALHVSMQLLYPAILFIGIRTGRAGNVIRIYVYVTLSSKVIMFLSNLHLSTCLPLSIFLSSANASP